MGAEEPAYMVTVPAGQTTPAEAWTKAVVAIWVVLVPPLAVGAVGIPIMAGESKGALLAMAAPTVAEEPAGFVPSVVSMALMASLCLFSRAAATRSPFATDGMLSKPSG